MNVGETVNEAPAVPSAIVVASGVIDVGVGGDVDSPQAVTTNVANANATGSQRLLSVTFRKDMLGAIEKGDPVYLPEKYPPVAKSCRNRRFTPP
jgi:hypothetical protein